MAHGVERKNRHRGWQLHHYRDTLPFEPWNPKLACVMGSTT